MEFETDDTTFCKLSDDVVLKIFTLLEDDPRSWASLSCVCTKFNSLISSICCKSKCVASLSSDLLSLSSSHGFPWSSLFKLSVCCPGLLHCGVLLDNSDFGLHREIGSHDTDSELSLSLLSNSSSSSQAHNHRHRYDDRNDADDNSGSGNGESVDDDNDNKLFEGWSMYDDLYFDTMYDNSETSAAPVVVTTGVDNLDTGFNHDFKKRKIDVTDEDEEDDHNVNNNVNDSSNDIDDRRRQQRSHLATGAWNLSREQGMKLLASRFRDDCLYISEWPGCVHGSEEEEDHNNKRKYMLFRGVFSDFKKTRVWRTIKDGNHRSKIELNCAFCSCKETWDLHSAFCLKRGFGFHDDGEPVVRAYVCENGHVSGAWTDLPLYT